MSVSTKAGGGRGAQNEQQASQRADEGGGERVAAVAGRGAQGEMDKCGDQEPHQGDRGPCEGGGPSRPREAQEVRGAAEQAQDDANSGGEALHRDGERVLAEPAFGKGHRDIVKSFTTSQAKEMAAILTRLGEAATWNGPMQDIKRCGSNAKD